jgi:hypothetical protein
VFKENNRHVLTTKKELNNLYGLGGFIMDDGNEEENKDD